MTVKNTLSKAEVHDFRRNGCGVIRQIVTGADLEQLRDIVTDATQREDISVINVVESAGKQNVKQATAEYRKRLQLTRNIRLHYPAITDLARRLASCAAKLLGEHKVQILSDSVYVKPPQHEGSQPTPWHQDLPAVPVDRRGFFTFWIAVDDIPLEQGPLTFLPGSHRLGPLGLLADLEVEADIQALFSEEDQELVGEPTTTALEAGDATIHDGLMLHRAGANATDRPRRAWGVRFMPPNTLYNGAPHWEYEDLGLTLFAPFDGRNFPVISVNS